MFNSVMFDTVKLVVSILVGLNAFKSVKLDADILVPTIFVDVTFVEYKLAELICVVANKDAAVIVDKLRVLELIFVPTIFVDVTFVEYKLAVLICVVANKLLLVIVDKLRVLELMFVPTIFVDVTFVAFTLLELIFVVLIFVGLKVFNSVKLLAVKFVVFTFVLINELELMFVPTIFVDVTFVEYKFPLVTNVPASMLPFTSKVNAGFVVPIPTFPEPFIYKRDLVPDVGESFTPILSADAPA